jgi:6-phosphogluconolactonase
MKMDTRVFPDVSALSRAAFEELMLTLRSAISARGRFAIALSGGHTPAKLYLLWAHAEQYDVRTPWNRVHLFWGDERYVPHDDPASNYRMVRETLISQVPIPSANVHPMPTNFPLPQEAANAYEGELRKFFGASPPEFDLQLLGLGVEGHTASLFPGSAALEEKQRWVAAVEAPAQPSVRLTLTPAVLDRGRKTIFLVAGKDKDPVVKALRDEPESKVSQFPAGRIHAAGEVAWFLDQAAAG